MVFSKKEEKPFCASIVRLKENSKRSVQSDESKSKRFKYGHGLPKRSISHNVSVAVPKDSSSFSSSKDFTLRGAGPSGMAKQKSIEGRDKHSEMIKAG